MNIPYYCHLNPLIELAASGIHLNQPADKGQKGVTPFYLKTQVTPKLLRPF